ncbi:hypothetical protein [Flagellimonas sp.]|uniref:hypothetical protein n=1 Tax=Flagellimonas sp. TaxID=2058762 RepID=UPI003BAC7F43
MKKILTIAISISIFISCHEKHGEYVCTPCDLSCDTLSFEKAGVCPHCAMDLVRKSDLINEADLVLNDVQIKTGSGVFLIEGPEGKKDKTIKVYYHKPRNFSVDSKVLMVIPGAGRNGDSYRDAWKEESEKYNVLILSPVYEEEQYPFEEYHLCGLIKTSNLIESVTFKEGTNQAILNEDEFTFETNSNQNDWLFHDFDRIFDLVAEATNSSQTQYDIFGHSAGGQILHRLALLTSDMKVNHIIASNSGFYTLPDIENKMPFGIQGLYSRDEELIQSFNNQLILLIGELDNENEKGGTLLRSKTADEQGTHRLERAKYFYEFSKGKANDLNADFNWKIEIVPNVGHNYELMGNAAGKILYE